MSSLRPDSPGTVRPTPWIPARPLTATPAGCPRQGGTVGRGPRPVKTGPGQGRHGMLPTAPPGDGDSATRPGQKRRTRVLGGQAADPAEGPADTPRQTYRSDPGRQRTGTGPTSLRRLTRPPRRPSGRRARRRRVRPGPLAPVLRRVA